MRLELNLGDTAEIIFADSDGSILVSYGGQIENHVTVHTEWPDTSGREGLIYDEDFSVPDLGIETSVDETKHLKLVPRDSTGADDPAIVGDYDRELPPGESFMSASPIEGPQQRLLHLAQRIKMIGLVEAIKETYGPDHTWLVRDLLKAVSRG